MPAQYNSVLRNLIAGDLRAKDLHSYAILDVTRHFQVVSEICGLISDRSSRRRRAKAWWSAALMGSTFGRISGTWQLAPIWPKWLIVYLKPPPPPPEKSDLECLAKRCDQRQQTQTEGIPARSFTKWCPDWASRASCWLQKHQQTNKPLANLCSMVERDVPSAGRWRVFNTPKHQLKEDGAVQPKRSALGNEVNEVVFKAIRFTS